MTKKRHEWEIGLYQEAVDREYARAIKDGSRKVHLWAIDANYNVFNHHNPRGAAAAAFQEAERQFRPDPLTVKEVLEGAE
jgi:hypothetical protein